MNALSHIQVATATTAVPPASTSEGQAPRTSVFREAMHQALEPKNGSSKNLERIAPRSSPSTHTISSSPRTAQQGTLAPSKGDSRIAGSDGGEATPAGPSVPAANGVSVLGSDPNVSGNTQLLMGLATIPGLGSVGSAGSAVLGRVPGNGSAATAEPGAVKAKEMNAIGKNTEKSPSGGGSTDPAIMAATGSIAVFIALPPVLPAAKSLVGAVASATANDYPHMAASGALAKQDEMSTPKAEVPPASITPVGAPHDAVASSTNFNGDVAPSAATTADMTTSISSSDLLLNSEGGISKTQASPGSDLDGTASSTAALNGTSPVPATSAGAASKASGNFGDAGAAAGADMAVSAASRKTVPGESATTLSPLTPATAGQVPTTANIPSAHAGTSAAMSIGSSGVRNPLPAMTPSATFAAMDRADANPGAVLLHASPNQMAVGISDPGLGWIEVRAERVAGQITAALTANSTASHAELTAALPAMSSYLNDHRQVVHHIQIETGLASGQNPASSQEHSSGGQHRESAIVEPVGASTGVGDGLRIGATQTAQRVNHAVEVAPQKTKLDGHQFSVRA